MGDMDEWDCFKCGSACSYRPSNLCRTCEDNRLLLRNCMRQWFDDNLIPWDEGASNSGRHWNWKVSGKKGSFRVANEAGNDIICISSEAQDFIQEPEHVPTIVARLNYHDPNFFDQLEEAINGRLH